MPMLTADFLANIPIFRGTTEAERGQLLQVMRREHFDAGACVVESGIESRGLHVIVEGAASVVLDVHGYRNPVVDEGPTPTLDHADIAKLEIGSVFGEVSFFHGGGHTATIVAVTDLEVLTMTVEEFQQLLAHDNLAAYKVAMNAAHILADRLRNADELIAELVLAQQEPIARSRWFGDHLGLHTSPAEARFFH